MKSECNNMHGERIKIYIMVSSIKQKCEKNIKTVHSKSDPGCLRYIARNSPHPKNTHARQPSFRYSLWKQTFLISLVFQNVKTVVKISAISKEEKSTPFTVECSVCIKLSLLWAARGQSTSLSSEQTYVIIPSVNITLQNKI